MHKCADACIYPRTYIRIYVYTYICTNVYLCMQAALEMLGDACKNVRMRGVRELGWAARGCEAEAATLVAQMLDGADKSSTHVLLQALCAMVDGSKGTALDIVAHVLVQRYTYVCFCVCVCVYACIYAGHDIDIHHF